MNNAQVIDQFQQRHYLDVGDARVCYCKAGDGPALVLIHGFPLSSQTWRKIVPALSQSFTCYAFDVIGFGDSTTRNIEDYASQGQARAIQTALRKLEISSYYLLGNDSGGWIARELALLEPARVRYFILTNTEIPGHRPPWIPLYQFLARLPGCRATFRLILFSPRLLRSSLGFGGCFDNLTLTDSEFTAYFITPLQNSSARLSSALQFLASMNFQRVDLFRELHGNLTMPVAFIWGAAD